MEIKTMENTRYKILFIEDNQLDQMAFKRFVDENNIPYDCTIAGSVSEAQQALNSDQFDIVITDHSLGDGTAFEILKLAENTPVIVVTGAGDEETAIRAWKAGAYDYLIKDLSQNYLKAIPITVENAVSHKIIEKKLQLLSGAVMSTDDSVYISDMQGRIIFVNKAFCNTYGYKEQEIIGENSTVLWIGKQQTENTRSVFQTRTIGSSWEVGFYHKRNDDSVFPVSLSRSTIKDPNGNEVAIVGVARDISERILIEEELNTENQNLKKRIRELEEKLGIEHSYSVSNA
jgi:PAS domain S-box-containing protein